jgi:broad specificity phosphatase PhoE
VTELLLVRHGETDWNRARRWQGRDDPPLNELGLRQARELADSLVDERIDAIYSSDLRRALMTAEIVGERLDLPVQPLVELREIDVGSWSGLTRDELDERFPEQVARHLESWGTGWEDGETPDQLTERVVAAVRRIASDHTDDRVLLVAHGGVIRALTAVALDVPFGDFTRGTIVIANCSVARFACQDGALRSLD